MGTRPTRRKTAERPKGTREPRGLEEELLQRYSQAGTALLADEAPRRLDPTLRAEMETITGADLSDVRLHTGGEARRMARSMGARAFATGPSDVFFGPGGFDPGSPRGKSLLAHELTHVAEGESGMARVPRMPEREKLEIRARRVEEMVLAKEEAAKARPDEKQKEPATLQLPEAGGGSRTPVPRKVPVDKAALEEKVWQRLSREMKRQRERTGHL
mgnify:CR=1 FL=1